MHPACVNLANFYNRSALSYLILKAMCFLSDIQIKRININYYNYFLLTVKIIVKCNLALNEAANHLIFYCEYQKEYLFDIV